MTPIPINSIFSPQASLLTVITLSTITWASTTVESFNLFWSFRLGLVVLLVIQGLMQVAKRAVVIEKSSMISVCLLVIFWIYAAILGIANSIHVLFSTTMLYNFLTSLMLTFYLSVCIPLRFPTPVSLNIFASQTFMAFGLTILIGGVGLSVPPTFYLEVVKEGSEYSLPLAQYYGFGSICCVLRFLESKAIKTDLFWGFLTLSMWYITAVAGGRGEFFAASAVIGTVVAIKSWKLALLSATCLVCTVVIFDHDFTTDLPVFERISSIFEGNYSNRDKLLYEVFDLLFKQPDVLVFGGGFGYFQDFYLYEYGMHPHNLLAELVISIGLPLTIVFLYLVAVGLTTLIHESGYVRFMCFFAFFLVVNLKSSDLPGAWISVAALCTVAGIGVSPNMNTIRSRDEVGPNNLVEVFSYKEKKRSQIS